MRSRGTTVHPIDGREIMSTTKASRGDLCAIVTTSADYVIGQGRTERVRVALGTVTSVTRSGIVKAARTEYGSTLDLTRPNGSRHVLVVPAYTIDIERALSAYAERRYPSAPHSSMVPPFNSIDETRTFLASFRRELVAADISQMTPPPMR
jgi:hypothetical protein